MKLSIEVDEFERAKINAGIRDVIRTRNLNRPESQLYRVIQAAMGPRWYTLRDLELTVLNMFGHADTQTAISARLREVKPNIHGLKKERYMLKDDQSGKQVYFYRLVAATENEE
jgi:hypothetical protein